MTLDAIKAMPVADLAATDAHLWLWTTNAALENAFDVVRAWGFTPRSVLTWVKWPKLGLGVYLRNASEQVIFATRGKAPVEFRSQPSWFTAPTQEHSVKPEEIFSIVERVSPGPYLELFSRRRPSSKKDWSVWGNEVFADIEIPGYPVPRYSLRHQASAQATAATRTEATTDEPEQEPQER